MKTLADCHNNGEEALEWILAASEFRTIEQAVASLSVFTNPKIVKQTNNSALFRIRRYRQHEARGQIINEERVVLCDNTSPTSAFLWANDLGRASFSEVQFNHIYQESYDPNYYTSLANVFVAPAFLSKLTDTNPAVLDLLKYRVYREYSFRPDGEPEPTKPECYDKLSWPPFLPECDDLKQRLIQKIEHNQQSRIAISIRNFGWYFQ